MDPLATMVKTEFAPEMACIMNQNYFYNKFDNIISVNIHVHMSLK